MIPLNVYVPITCTCQMILPHISSINFQQFTHKVSQTAALDQQCRTALS